MHPLTAATWRSLGLTMFALAVIQPGAIAATDFDKTVPVSMGGELRIDLDAGGAVVIHGWDQPKVHVSGQLRGRDAGESQVSLEAGASGATLHGWQANGLSSPSTSHRFDIDVPASFKVRIRSAGGGVRVTGVRGEMSGRTGGGDLVFDRVGGRVSLETGGGEIRVDSSDFSGSLITGGGAIVVGASAGDIVARTGAGRIALGLVNGSVTASTGSGDVTVAVTGRDGDERSVTVTSGAGSVSVALPGAFSARFDLEAAYTADFGRKAKVTSDFALSMSETTNWDDSAGSPRKYVRGVGAEGGGRGSIRVRVVNGDITVRRQ